MENRDRVDFFNKRFQIIREIAFRPILKILTHLNVTSNSITNLRFLGAVLFYIFFQENPIGSTFLLLIVLVLDTLDGAIARFQGVASDRGKFLDVFIDHVVYSLVVLVIFNTEKNLQPIAYHLFIIPVVYLLATIKKEEFHKSDWLIKVYPRLSYLKALVIASFFLNIFIKIDLIPQAILLSNTIATLLSVYYFLYIQVRWNKIPIILK